MHFRLPLVVVLALGAATLSQQAFSQMDHSMHGTHGGPAKSAPAHAMEQASMDDATVKKVDVTKATVTLAHGALSNGMPAMTMTYRVKDPVWLEKMTAGQKIRFAAESVDGGMMMVRFESVQ